MSNIFRGKELEYTEKNFSLQSGESTNFTYPGHMVDNEESYPLCNPSFLSFFSI